MECLLGSTEKRKVEEMELSGQNRKAMEFFVLQQVANR